MNTDGVFVGDLECDKQMPVPRTTDDDVYITTSLRDAEEVIANLNEWRSLTDSAMRLRIGEASAQEIRTVRAVLMAVSSYPANVAISDRRKEASDAP